MPFVRPHRTYYKYGTEPNVTVVGSPTIGNGVVSGFTTANYLMQSSNFRPQTSTWEIGVDVITGADISNTQFIVGNGGANYKIGIGLIGNHFLLSLSNINSSWNIANDLPGAHTVLPNTYYKLRVKYTGVNYSLDYSLNGIDWYEDIVVNNSAAIYDAALPLSFGANKYASGVNVPFLGSIDLTKSYIKINGEDWWRGTKAVESNKADADYHVDSNKLYNLARRKRVYYKDGVEVSEIKYYKDVVTTKYWKEVTTGSRELEYACYIGDAGGFGVIAHWYAKAPLGSDNTLYRHTSGITQKASSSSELVTTSDKFTTLTETSANIPLGNAIPRSYADDLYKDTTTTTVVEGTPEDYTYTTEETTKVEVSADDDWDSVNYDSYEDRLIAHSPTVQDDFTYRITHKQTATGTYTITLDKDYEGNLLFVGNGGGGGSSANDSYWRNSSGGSGACFQGRVSLPKGTYTLTIGTLGYGYFIGNTANMTGGADSTDSYLTDENGNELIRVGCGKRGTVIGQGGAGGTLTLGTLEVLETTKAVNGNTGEWNNQYGQGVQKFAKSAYDGTTTGYGAGTSSYYGGGNVYGVAGIFKLDIEYLDKGLRSY